MLIPINFPNPAQNPASNLKLPPQLAQFGTDEVVLIELQGSLDVEGNKDGQQVGKLCIDDTTKKSTLRIGHHLLEGKLVNLPKPLAVLHRSTAQGDMDDTMQIGDESDGGSPQGKKEWDIVTIVRRKMVFAKRPMPIVGRTAPLTSSSGRKT